MVNTNELCEFLDWDSQFFGCRIARAKVHRLDESMINSISKWSRFHKIDCLYFLAEADDASTIKLAEYYGLHFVDIRVTLEKQLGTEGNISSATPPGNYIRQSTLDDISELRAIAKSNHRYSRFYFDMNFPTSLCDALYETWIEKSCNGYADLVLVAEIEGKPVGYISCHLLDKTKGQIGLLGVNPNFRGKSFGQVLVNKSLQWFARQGETRVTVVTQGRNCKALRIYQKCGFLIQSLQLWYHWWF